MCTSKLLRHACFLSSFALLLLAGLPLRAQVDPSIEQGLKPYGSYHGGNIDTVSLTNGNLFFRTPLLSYSQRGGELAVPIVLTYNNKNFTFTIQCAPPPAHSCITTAVFGAFFEGSPNLSRGASVNVGVEGVPYIAIPPPSIGINTSLSLDGNAIFVPVSYVLTPGRYPHVLVKSDSGWYTTDGSGFNVDANGTLRDSNGNKFTFPNGAVAEDPNGNQIGFNTPTTDTLGRQFPAASTASLSACPALGYANQAATSASTWNLPTVSGGTLPLILCYASVYVRTNFFGGSTQSHREVSSNFTVLQSVVFPNGKFWAFQYDAADPNNTNSFAYGDLLKVTFPTGGSIAYTWAMWPGCVGNGSGSGGFSRAVSTRTVDANDGAGPHTWTYFFDSGSASINDPLANNVVTDPAGNDTVHTITGLSGVCSLYETQTQYFQGSHTSGTLLKSVKTEYQFTSSPYDPGAVSNAGSLTYSDSVTNVFPTRVTTTLPNGLVSKVETDYDTALAYHGALDGVQYNNQWCTTDQSGNTQCGYSTPITIGPTNYTGSFGKVIATREYDWGQGAPGALLRQTATSYLWQSNGNYLSNNFLNLVSSNTVYDGAGSQKAQTTYGYDEYAPNTSGVTTQFNANPVNGAFRGNQTSAHRWLNGSTVSTTNCPIAVSNGFLVSYTKYNDTGTVYQSTDSCGTSAGDPNHTSTFAYSSAFAGAYPTSVTNTLGQTASTNYDFNTSLPISQTDLNGQVTTLSYDSMWRPTQVTKPDLGQTTFCYTDTGGASCAQAPPPFKVVVTKKINPAQNEVSTAVVDRLGRKIETQLNSDPNCVTKVDTAYDALGRLASVTNPFCTTSDTTYGVTSYSYDALNRTTQVTHPDGAAVTTSYTGRAVQVTDEGNGTRSVQRTSQSDALGRLLSVCEVTSTTLTGTGGTPAACGLDIAGTGFLTTYTYDTLNNLTNVSQGGYLSRSFTYDSLSRLTQATNPESGTISYAYDANGNVITRTDARSIITTYAYEKLNRLFSKSYSDTTPSASFVYDGCPSGGCPSGINPQFPVGRMVEASTSNTGTFFSYDKMGRTASEWQCTPVNCGTSTGYFALIFGYDANGDLTSQSNGFGVTLTNAFDNAARLTGVTSSLSDASHPANLLSAIQYNTLGLPRAESLGNNVSETTLSYDTRMRLVSLTATSPTATSATPGQATVTVSGSENSRQNAATQATAQVSVSGTNHQHTSCNRNGCYTVYDFGKVFVTVNGHEYDYFFGNNGGGPPDSASSVAGGLVSAIQADGARVVNASCSDSPCSTPTVTLTAVNAGSAGNNISFATGYTYDSGASFFASQGPSFTTSPASGNLSGGADVSTTYDTGTVTITVNGVPTSTSYNSGSSANSLAANLASALSGGTLVNATASGNVITITSKTVGASTNYSLAVSNSSSNGFSPPSFSASPSGSALTGGSGASAGTVYRLSMSYAPNGDVLSANDSANGNWTYAYDDFNRLLSSNKNSGAAVYGYVYDRFGNRWQQNGPNSMLLTFTGNNPGNPQNNNRMDGYTYDAAGNVTYDLNNNYTYDAENRIIQVTGTLGTTTYTYDAMGQRVRKTVSGVTTDYVYDLEGHAIAEVSGSGGWSRGEVFAGGKHIATYANSTTYFSHADWLGTERVRSDMSGAPCETISSLPFGDGQSTSGSCGDPSTRHFTGKERDMESGLDNFGARYNSSNLGRFMSPDPGNISGLLYQSDPQSWNGYAYARNNPLLYTDPDGDVYQICDNDGNCTNISDEDFEKDFQNANNVQLKDNQIYIKDSNGDFQLQGSFKQTSVDDRIGSLAGALPLAGQMAAPGVNLAANGLRAFGYVVAAPLMVTAECLAGAPSCTKGNVAMAILPEVGALREGAILLKEGAAVGKAAEILEKTGGAAQAAKDFEGLQGAEKVYGSTKVKTLSDGTKAVLYKSTSGGSTIALQDAAGRTVTKIRY